MSLEEAPRLLGVQLSPTRHFPKHIELLKTKADTFALRLKVPLLTVTEDALLFHKTIYIPAMHYSLASLAVDEECLKPIQYRSLKNGSQQSSPDDNQTWSCNVGRS
jgi:hypothetical protein